MNKRLRLAKNQLMRKRKSLQKAHPDLKMRTKRDPHFEVTRNLLKNLHQRRNRQTRKKQLLHLLRKNQNWRQRHRVLAKIRMTRRRKKIRSNLHKKQRILIKKRLHRQKKLKRLNLCQRTRKMWKQSPVHQLKQRSVLNQLIKQLKRQLRLKKSSH